MGVTKLVVTGVRQGVKYAPAITVVVREVRGPATEYAKARLEASRQRRLAVVEAESLREGTVLRVLRGDQPVWVVFSGDEPVSAPPAVDGPLADLVARADLGRRRRPEDFPTARQRVARAGGRVKGVRLRPRRAASVADADAQLVGEGVGQLDQLGPADEGAAQAGQSERGDEPST